MDTDLYVGNLGSTITEEALRAAFTAAGGSVKNVIIMRSPQNGRSRGFGFVRLGSEEDAAAAIRTMNGVEVEGRLLKVGDARERVRPGRNDGRRFDEDGGYGSTRRPSSRRSGGSKRRR